MINVFSACLYYDMKVLVRHRAQWINPILFFSVFVVLFGISAGDNTQLLQFSPVIIWISFLLTSLFTIENLFRSDQESGLLEQCLLGPTPLWWTLNAKSLALWVGSCLPLIMIIPLIGFMMQLNAEQIFYLTLSLLAGSPALAWLGTLGAALTIALSRGGVFLGLLLLPLYVPVLILGQSATSTVLSSEPPLFQIALLAAISVLAITLAPHGAAMAIRAAIDE
jgi:heme exporter protein B